MKAFKILVILIMVMFALPICAQTSCDKLFASGVKFQQTMTIASQNKAITYFEKAKVCFDSQAKKDLCDQQIKACRNIIAQLSKKAKSTTTTKPQEDSDTLIEKPNVPENHPSKKDVKLSTDCTYLKFKGKGGEFKKAKIICNYPDWEIAAKPDWVNCSKNDDELVVEAEKNPNKEERSGSIIIESVSYTHIRDKETKATLGSRIML